VNRTIENRELFSLDVFGVPLQGTYHCAHANERNRTGILLLTGLSTPRAAHGDSGVYWAQSFADVGYPAFRIDLPASGDSGGDVFKESLPFISGGGQGPVTVEIVKQLIDRHALTGVVIMGHCASTISALFAAASCKGCRGLVLLDPYFYVPQVAQALRLEARLALVSWVTRSRVGDLLRRLYRRLNYMRTLLRRNILPRNANLPLLGCWKDLASAGLPILVLKAPGPKPSGTKDGRGEFDYFDYLVKTASNRNRIEVKIIEGAGHTFANHAGRTAVQQIVRNWLAVFFPSQDREEELVTTGRGMQSRRQLESANPEPLYARSIPRQRT
jgi:pimeloyl-ACP methyl ester carboxylesterase